MKAYKESKSIPPVSGIYSLHCPQTGDIRYIGKSKNIRNRFHGHMGVSKANKYPVAMWIKELRECGSAPNLCILHKASNEMLDDLEIAEISKHRNKGCNLLNLHSGGAHPSAAGNGKNVECWSVFGTPDPYRVLRNIYMPHNLSSKRIKEVSRSVSANYKSLSSEFDRVNFHLKCAKTIIGMGIDSRSGQMYEWLEKAAPQINEKYHGTVILNY